MDKNRQLQPHLTTRNTRWLSRNQVDGSFLVELRESDLMDSIGMEHKLHLKKLMLARQKLMPLSAAEQSMASSVRREEAATAIREEIPDIDTAFSQVRTVWCESTAALPNHCGGGKRKGGSSEMAIHTARRYLRLYARVWALRTGST